jgi:hypothetical protein
MANATHQAFNNLFVQTEINTQRHAIICTRRPRSQEEHSPWMFHLMKVHDASTESIAYETDRAKFIGRGNSVHHPAAMERGASLSGSQGSVLDPIVSIQYRIVIDPHETATVDMVFGLADSREICNGLIEKYQDRPLTDRAFELAWTHSQVVLRQINATVGCPIICKTCRFRNFRECNTEQIPLPSSKIAGDNPDYGVIPFQVTGRLSLFADSGPGQY